MRILYLAPIDPSRDNGPALHVRRICTAFEARGHQVRLLCHRPRRRLDWRGPAGGMVVRGGPAMLPVPHLRHLASEAIMARSLREERRLFRPDLVLVRQEALTISPWLAGRPPGVRPAPLVVESNSSLPEIAAAAGASPARVRRLARWEGKLLRTAAAVGCVSEELAALHRDRHRVAADRLFVVPNGAWVPPPLEDASGALRREAGVASDDFLVGFAGNFNAVQGLELLLDLLSRPDLPQVRGWIIGDAPERARWEEIARSRGARAAFLGAMSEEEADRRIQACQVAIAPYRAGAFARCAPSSLKILSALACDRPLLASDAPGLESLRDLASVTLVPSSDPEVWARVLRGRLDAWVAAGRPPREWPWPEGKGPGRAFIESGRTWDHTAAAWEAAFARALAG